MNSKTILLCLAALLIFIGLVKPDLSSLFQNKNSVIVVDDIDFIEPSSDTLKEKAKDVIKALSLDTDRKTDGKKLAKLYTDIATLITLDGTDQVIKNTEEIKQANRLAGLMLHLDIKDKYEGLSEAAQALIVEAIGDDQVLLSSDLRNKAVDGFKALAWACNEGSK
jgi:hypothetical protein